MRGWGALGRRGVRPGRASPACFPPTSRLPPFPRARGQSRPVPGPGAVGLSARVSSLLGAGRVGSIPLSPVIFLTHFPFARFIMQLMAAAEAHAADGQRGLMLEQGIKAGLGRQVGSLQPAGHHSHVCREVIPTVSAKGLSTTGRRPTAPWGVAILHVTGHLNTVMQDCLYLLDLLREGALKKMHLFRNWGTSNYLNWSCEGLRCTPDSLGKYVVSECGQGKVSTV